MKYRVKIEEQVTDEEAKYPSWKDVYEQIVDDLDVTLVICAVNGLKQKEEQ